MSEQTLIPNLFRTEFSKIVAVLCKTYGFANIALAEDIVSDTFLIASETWGHKGTPDNPKAWLYKVAKNKTLDHFRRNQNFDQKIKPELSRQKKFEEGIDQIDLTEENIKDSQLKMIFAVCNPLIPQTAQIALALRILCGFGIEEIASALLTNKATINKRLQRAKSQIRKHQIDITFPKSNQLNERISVVQSVIYLLFNEGYYSITSNKTIQKDLCFEAMRLLLLLINNKATNLPSVNAQMALFCFHASRFDARVNQLGEIILYDNQNQKDWNNELIAKGEFYLSKSANGNSVTKYHLEAIIAFWHTRKEDTPNKWEEILQIYNRLLQIEYSPITALNRTYALAKARGNKAALKEALKVNLVEHHLYHVLLAELYKGIELQKQVEHLKIAFQLAKTENDKKIIDKKLKSIH